MSAVAVAYRDRRTPVGVNAPQWYRRWSRNSEWVRGAITIRRSQIGSAEWDIVPHEKDRPYSRRLARRIKDLLLSPSGSNSFRSFIEPVIEDLLVLDAGCIEKERNLLGELVGLHPVDGATVRIDPLWSGDPNAIRYYWYPDGQLRATWRDRDFIYIVSNPRTDSPTGLSALETLRLTIESELAAMEYNRRQVLGAAPDGVFSLGEGVTSEQVEEFRAYFESEIAGRGAVGFVGGARDPKWIPFHSSNRDMQFLEWQIFLVRKIAVVFGLTPQDLGVTFDINRSTSEVQIQISEDRGLRPLMGLLQEYLTREVVWDDAFGGKENNLAFRFTALNIKESTARAQINERALAGVPWRYINEVRMEEGREPIPALEGKIIMATPQGALDISDVPTVREYMEMLAGRWGGNASAGGGNASAGGGNAS